MPAPEAICAALRETAGFVDVGVAVCRLIERGGFAWCSVTLIAPTGRPLIMIDNARGISDEHRTGFVSENWREDPHLAHVCRHHQPAGDEDALTLPILKPGGLLGFIRVAHHERIHGEVREELVVLATHVSVQLTRLGVTTSDGTSLQLTRRQLDVAELAARDHTIEDIRKVLKLSANTVKKHLKDVYARLEVSGRIALAKRLAAERFPVEVPIGVTRRDHVTITRAG